MSTETYTVRRGQPVGRPHLWDGWRPEPVSASVVIDGHRYAVTTEVTPLLHRRPSDARAYVSGTPSPLIPRPPLGWAKGLHPDIDAAWRVYNAAEERIWRAALEAVVEGKWAFSRKAGCPCGCSPGFINKTSALFYGARVDVTARPF